MKGLKGRLRATLSHLFEFEDCGDALRVTTALVSPHGDYITLYVHPLQEGGYEVSDDGETLRQLELLGIIIHLEKIRDICNSLKVEISDGKLTSRAQGTLELARSIIWTAQAASFLLWDSGREK
ncbi:MAG: DUF1828 domain-containing protein [Thermodesulfobacteriota bacterium]